jgi:hypothetical protein
VLSCTVIFRLATSLLPLADRLVILFVMLCACSLPIHAICQFWHILSNGKPVLCPRWLNDALSLSAMRDLGITSPCKGAKTELGGMAGAIVGKGAS